jgi:hypothetical protein
MSLNKATTLNQKAIKVEGVPVWGAFSKDEIRLLKSDLFFLLAQHLGAPICNIEICEWQRHDQDTRAYICTTHPETHFERVWKLQGSQISMFGPRDAVFPLTFKYPDTPSSFIQRGLVRCVTTQQWAKFLSYHVESLELACLCYRRRAANRFPFLFIFLPCPIFQVNERLLPVYLNIYWRMKILFG